MKNTSSTVEYRVEWRSNGSPDVAYVPQEWTPCVLSGKGEPVAFAERDAAQKYALSYADRHNLQTRVVKRETRVTPLVRIYGPSWRRR